MSKTSDTGGSLRLYRRLLGYALPYKGKFVIAVIGMIVLSITSALFAAMMRPLVDNGFVGKDMDTIRLVPPLIIGLFLARGIANFVAQYSVSWVGRRITFDIRNAIFTHLTHLPSGFYDTNASGSLISKLIFDVEQIAAAVTESIFVIVRDGLTVAVMAAWMIYLNWKLTIFFAILAPISSLLVRAMSLRFRKTSQLIQKSMGEISQVTQEATEGQRVVKAFGGHATEIRAFTEVNERNRRQAMRKVTVSAVGMGLVQLLAAIALALVIYFALLSGEITAGGFVSYITAVTWMMNPSKRLSKINETIQTGLAAAHSAFALMDEPAEMDTGTVTLAHVRGRIEYRHVGFRYPVAESEALQDVSFTIEPGQTVALVGASGSGKTTTASLLPRFYRLNEGEIRLDDGNINDLVLADLRRHIAIVGQETLLFDDTIRHNIAYGHEGPIDEDRVMQAARAAHVLEFAQKLPQGLDALVGERGMRVSGGQRQRIAIARALYKNAPILILDEATSSLDTESERLVQAAMQTLMENRTTLVIAHRLSTVEHADRIVVLAQGRVVESGTHRELLAQNGVYAGLYRIQFSTGG
ncbi:lipid A export permease/ATP-binding protein MsbA [Sulfuricaulis sp.]|uniref:lipid A export permease/ATP-binding protein MsbA n=1 Tax=Sulfuricaulis sp. TaxID=2003553 RepID=UPI0035593B88